MARCRKRAEPRLSRARKHANETSNAKWSVRVVCSRPRRRFQRSVPAKAEAAAIVEHLIHFNCSVRLASSSCHHIKPSIRLARLRTRSFVSSFHPAAQSRLPCLPASRQNHRWLNPPRTAFELASPSEEQRYSNHQESPRKPLPLQ